MTDEMRKLRNEVAMRYWLANDEMTEERCFQIANKFIAELEKQDALESKPTADEIAAAEKRGYTRGLETARAYLVADARRSAARSLDDLISSSQQGEKSEGE